MTDEKKRLIPTLLDSWQNLWRKKQPTNPDKPVDTPAPNNVPWLRVGLLLKSIPFKQLSPVFFTVPALLFFAISGLIAWIVVVLRFAVNIFDALV